MRDHLIIMLRDEELWLSSRRCLWWPSKKTLIVADLHLGKGIDFSKNATLLPPYDTLDTLNRLRQLVEAMNPKRVICLGDNFHRQHSYQNLQEFEQQMIYDLAARIPEWVWIMGNHDSELPADLYGSKVRYINDHPLSFYHQPNLNDWANLQIVGHFHPKYITTLKGRHLSKPCFIWSKTMLIMPSFGSYTGGLRIDHPEIIEVMGKSFQIATADTEPKPVLIVK